MARRLKPLSEEHLPLLPTACSGCVFWESDEPLEISCGARCDEELQRSWLHTVRSEWGECGRIALEEGEVLGFIKYAPARYLPQARRMPAGPPADDAPLIACMHIVSDARRHGLGRLLLLASLRDLFLRGERSVQAYALAQRGDMEAVPVVGVEFLLRHGFTVTRAHPAYPLMRLDLRSLATVQDNLESVLESLRIPLGVPRRAPVTWPSGENR